MANEITSYYPLNIRSEENKLRSIKILVKEQISLTGATEELKKQLEKTSKNILKIYKQREDGATNSSPSNAEQRKGITERMKNLTTVRTVWGLALPLPNELSDSQSHKWDTTEGVVSKIGNQILDFGSGKLTKGKASGSSTMQALGELASVAGARKPMIDPGYFQDYNGTEPRSFSFSWDLIPNNATDSESIQDIIYNLKKFTLPTSTINGISLLSPYVFDIEMGNEKINQLMNINNVVCTEMTVNYAAEGALQFFRDGTPKYIKLDMSFMERSTITADIY